MNYGFRPLTDMRSRIALCNSTARFVELMDAFFGYDREAVVQLPILPWRAPNGNPKWADGTALCFPFSGYGPCLERLSCVFSSSLLHRRGDAVTAFCLGGTLTSSLQEGCISVTSGALPTGAA